jgi:hypothetical protein
VPQLAERVERLVQLPPQVDDRRQRLGSFFLRPERREGALEEG